MWTGTVLLVLIGVTAVVIRVVVLVTGPRAGRGDVDDGFAHHPVLTLHHIIPGLLFFLLAPLQFVRRLRNRAPKLIAAESWINYTRPRLARSEQAV